MDFKSRLSTIVLVLFVVACSENILSEFAETDTYDALVFEARKELNNRNFASASTLFEQAGGATGADLLRGDQADYASSYSGQCGLEFISLVETLEDTGGSTILTILMSAFPNSTTEIYAHCLTAENVLDDNIGNFSSLSGDENLLMAFNSFAKIGAILNTKADNDDNNGVADGSFDVCNTADTADSLTQNEVAQIGTGLARIVTSLGAVGGSYADIDDLTAVCADPNVVALDLCNLTETTQWMGNEIAALRNLIGSTDYGLGTCGDTFTNCLTPGPPGTTCFP